ncbi:MAG: hypothetical protein H7257_12600 [Taibaiella sp.]|nr:hypothetical protein [Taibaiella sp.]
MKSITSALLIICMATTGTGFAQPKMHPRAIERIHAAKSAYITDRLHLTVEQATSFIPVYNEYEKDIMQTRKSYLQKYKNMDMQGADDATSMQYIDDNLDYQQEVIAIKRKYKEPFLKVITPQQYTDLAKAEREFKQLLKQRLKERKNAGNL